MPALTAALLAAAAAATSPPPEAPRLRFERVDLLAEAPGTWLSYDLPLAGISATSTAVRFVEQVKVVWGLPAPYLYAGASLSSQSLSYERPLWSAWHLDAVVGLDTKLLLPRGAYATIAWHYRWLRLAVGVSASSAAIWSEPDYDSWVIVPTLGVGVGRERRW